MFSPPRDPRARFEALLSGPLLRAWASDKRLSEVVLGKHNLDGLNEDDIHWFLWALEAGYARHEDGWFRAGVLTHRLFLFETKGRRGDVPRQAGPRVEEIVTVGACARLIELRGWPRSQIGFESPKGLDSAPFDLSGYRGNSNVSPLLVAGECKVDGDGLGAMLDVMREFAGQPPLAPEPRDGRALNLYRKVVGIRHFRPSVFWLYGPRGREIVCEVAWKDDDTRFDLLETDAGALEFSRFS